MRTTQKPVKWHFSRLLPSLNPFKFLTRSAILLLCSDSRRMLILTQGPSQRNTISDESISC